MSQTNDEHRLDHLMLANMAADVIGAKPCYPSSVDGANAIRTPQILIRQNNTSVGKLSISEILMKSKPAEQYM